MTNQETTPSQPTSSRRRISPVVMAVVVIAIIVIAVLSYNALKPASKTAEPSSKPHQQVSLSASDTSGIITGQNGTYLSPTAQSYSSGSSFTAYIRENSGQTLVNAAQINMTYPADLLKVTKVDSSTSNFKIQAQNDAAGGKINLARGSTSPLTGDQLIATITFQTIAPGAAQLQFTDGTAIVNAATHQSIADSLPAAVTYTIQ
jgi:cytoskeletal protein RodZ